MKKVEMKKMAETLVLRGTSTISDYRRKMETVNPAIENFEARIGGKKGAEDARDRFAAMLVRLFVRASSQSQLGSASRKKVWERKSAESLARKAGMRSDEHGSWSGDHHSVQGLSFVGPWESAAAPYWDMGSEGLGLVDVTRTRHYAKSSNWRPSSVSTRFLVGKNEAGTYFSHPVSLNCLTVEEAVEWIWNGKARYIIQRQGDVALIGGNGGPKMPSSLPWGHKVEGGKIVHATHPELRFPQNPGERIIVGRRAAERATSATRD